MGLATRLHGTGGEESLRLVSPFEAQSWKWDEDVHGNGKRGEAEERVGDAVW